MTTQSYLLTHCNVRPFKLDNLKKHIPKYESRTTYTSKEEHIHHAQNQIRPEHVQHQQDDKHEV